MFVRMKPTVQVKKAKSPGSREVLERLQNFLEQDAQTGVLVRVFGRTWEDQRDALSYQELRQLVLGGGADDELLRLWRQDYSRLVSGTLSAKWMAAAAAGAAGSPLLADKPFEFNFQTPGALNWLDRHGGEFVTACVQEQRQAVSTLVTKKMLDKHSVDELAELIRPCIGLNGPQAQANARYYDRVLESLRENHPRKKEETIQREAREAALKYAERQHRYRAEMIAQTESAFAYNWGLDEGMRQAQAAGFLGKLRKKWSTSGDDGVCNICSALEGVELDMDEEFNFKGRILFSGSHCLPPAHPWCGCGIEYIEVSPPAVPGIPQLDADTTQAGSLREYSTEEIEKMAAQTEEIASRHISTPSLWSGNIIVSEEGIQNSDGHITYYGKLWNCDIITKHETAPAVILHEQVHARSISHYGQEIFFQFALIEEAAVQLMTQEICLRSGIEIIESVYDVKVESLRKIGQYIGVHKTDYEFARFMIEMPVPERLNWLSDNLYATLGRDTGVSVEEFQNWSARLEVLFTER